jgi:hypothetical protein
MQLFRLLVYFHAALECDVPIVEALWITGDRLRAEFTLLLPRLHYLLTEWGFSFKAKKIFWERSKPGSEDFRSCLVTFGERVGWGQLLIRKKGAVTTLSFKIAYPRNDYQIFDHLLQVFVSFPSREVWWKAVCSGLKPPDYLLPSRPFEQCEYLALPPIRL